MTYQENPNRNRRATEETNYTPWAIGGALALALIIGGFMMFGRDAGTNSTANNSTNRPAATTTAPATTGSGTVTPRPDPVQPANPAGNTPTAPGSAR